MTVVQELEQAHEALTNSAATVADLTARLEASGAALAAAEQVGRDALAHAAEISEAKAKADGDLKAAEALIAEQAAARDAAVAELARVREAMALNPAMADAVAPGAAAPASDGAPGSDPQPVKTRAQWDAEYIRVRDEQGPKAAAEFRAAHAVELGISKQ